MRRRAFDSLNVDPEPIRERVAAWKDQGATTKEALRKKATSYHARAAAKHGFWTGLVPGVAGSVLVSVLDAKGVARERATLSATYGYIEDPSFFDEPDYALAIAHSLESGVLKLPSDATQEDWESTALSFHLKSYAVRALRRSALRWAGKRFVGGAPGLLVPVVGGAIGAGWNYAELRWVASRYDNDPPRRVAA